MDLTGFGFVTRYSFPSFFTTLIVMSVYVLNFEGYVCYGLDA